MTRSLTLLALALAPIAPAAPPTQPQTAAYGYKVVHVYPHDRTAFTQGLEYRDGYLYEGTGLEGRSTLRKVDLTTGRVMQEARVPPALFGEGITVMNGKIFELTWQSQIGFIYDKASFKVVQTFRYPGEGWGLTNDGRRMFMSDGSADIRKWNAETLAEEGRFTVRDAGRPVSNLNELEYVRGELLANIWQTDRIARISVNDGHVLGWIDMTGLLSPADKAEPVDVLNGIAYDSAGDRLFVTGKLWPKLFEIRVVKK